MVSTLAQYLHLQVGSLSVACDLVDCHVVWGCSSPVLSPKPHQWLKVSPVGEPGRLHRPGSHLGHLLKIYDAEVVVVEPLTTKVKELVSRHLWFVGVVEHPFGGGQCPQPDHFRGFGSLLSGSRSDSPVVRLIFWNQEEIRTSGSIGGRLTVI